LGNLSNLKTNTNFNTFTKYSNVFDKSNSKNYYNLFPTQNSFFNNKQLYNNFEINVVSKEVNELPKSQKFSYDSSDIFYSNSKMKISNY
jgi:hypothetical protein